ncbi:MAG: hydantoinase/oxoprolinase family protein [Rhodospirillales bacterium]|nr:hydantoinase/oxoprolinase family protein [Rhodospirillales bacterium]
MSFRVGIDIGGTFTDLVAIDASGRVTIAKIASTPADYTAGIMAGLARLSARAGGEKEVAEVLHASTIASNALLEGKGAKTALITTAGFRDVLEIRDLRMPRLYDLAWRKPPPLVPRRLRLEVVERIRPDGSVARPLDETSLAAAIARLAAERVESVAIAFLHSYANPVHERAVAAAVRAALPGISISESAEILPEIKEYPRTSTAAINAFIQPLVADYLGRLAEKLRGGGIAAPLRLLQSNGGLATPAFAERFPAHLVESGPAAGVVGAAALARRLAEPRLISFDMGGTTAKAGLVEGGRTLGAEAMEVGGGVLAGARLLTGAGYLLKLPSIDLAEVGAGGGSICRLDAAGAPKVGPESAGAEPGPVCYGLGGTEPTITDCNLVLGYLDPAGLAGGTLKLDRAAAAAALARAIAAPLGLSLEEAAHGMLRIATAGMMRAVRAITVERGRDPRDFSLLAFGGNGPLFAAWLAAELGIARVLVPPHPGIFSAFGLLVADTEYHFARSLRTRMDNQTTTASFAALASAAAGLRDEGAARLAAEGFPPARQAFRSSALARYAGQSSEIAVPLPPDAAPACDFRERFASEHLATYGFRAPAGEPVEITGLALVARGLPEHPRLPERIIAETPPQAAQSRPCWFPGLGWMETPVLPRGALGPAPLPGPLIVAEYDATVLVPPGASAAADDFGMIRITLGS